jgi:hypothetical protein
MASIINSTTTAGVTVTGDNSGSLQLATNNGTTAVTIDTSQNVGIGTASPASFGKLAVTGVSNFGVDQTDYIGIQGGGGTARIDAFGSNTNINTSLSTKGTGSFYIWRGGYGGTNTLLIDGSSNLQFNSGYGSVATAYGCRAWVNFNGAGTVSIRGSGNVSSVSDNGTGYYGVNYTTSLVDGNYSAVATANEPSGAMRIACTTGNATSNDIVYTFNGAGSLADVDVLNFAVFR